MPAQRPAHLAAQAADDPTVAMDELHLGQAPAETRGHGLGAAHVQRPLPPAIAIDDPEVGAVFLAAVVAPARHYAAGGREKGFVDKDFRPDLAELGLVAIGVLDSDVEFFRVRTPE